MITCKEASHLISIQDEEKLSLSTKLKLRLHLMLCKTCMYFAKHIEILKSSVKNLVNDPNISFSETKKMEFEKKIKENLK